MAREIHATYRVQLHTGFGFEAAAAIADYVAALGISHLYSSPYLQAGRGSMHGYDIVNPHRLNEELGGAEAHARFCEALSRHGLGQVLDIVPNHMAITGAENPWWWDVLENGPASRYAAYFDVDGTHPRADCVTAYSCRSSAIITAVYSKPGSCGSNVETPPLPYATMTMLFP